MEAESTAPQDPETSLTRKLNENMNLTRSESEWVALWLSRHPRLIVEAMLWAIGDNPLRDGLRNTPQRVVASWQELYAGYGRKPEDVFTRSSDKGFDCERYDQMVILRNVPFSSTCEHHIMPFMGVAHVAYLPQEDAAGLLGVSKLARLVELHARRLQNQERITQSVVDDLMEVSGARGAGVQLVATHNCMVCRGVMKPGSEMVTTALKGMFQESSVKAEFLSAIRG